MGDVTDIALRILSFVFLIAGGCAFAYTHGAKDLKKPRALQIIAVGWVFMALAWGLLFL